MFGMKIASGFRWSGRFHSPENPRSCHGVGRSHGALTAYIVKITSTFLGDNPLGYRFGFALAGMLAVWAGVSSDRRN